MKTYLAYKNQIKGFEDVSETIKTVEKIAASSIHFLKEETTNLDFYNTEVKKALDRLSLFYDGGDYPLTSENTGGHKAIVIVTGDKGLVGGLWHSVINSFLETTGGYQDVIAVGTKGATYLKEENISTIKSFPKTSDNISEEENIRAITDFIFDLFGKKNLSKIDILYPKFISLAEQNPTLTAFLPFHLKMPEKPLEAAGFPVFEPSKKLIFDSLIKKYISLFFYKITEEAKLSELSARTVAMEDAAIKTENLKKKLIINYTKESHRFATQKELESFAARRILSKLNYGRN